MYVRKYSNKKRMRLYGSRLGMPLVMLGFKDLRLRRMHRLWSAYGDSLSSTTTLGQRPKWTGTYGNVSVDIVMPKNTFRLIKLEFTEVSSVFYRDQDLDYKCIYLTKISLRNKVKLESRLQMYVAKLCLCDKTRCE